ncbi:MAG TPA: DNA repair protein [Nitrospiraceae bacterium]|nr:DNA repair protein [Nitrospiraceae bacterium]
MKERIQKTLVFTIGHSTRPVSEFIEIIKTYKIKEVVDIRTIPKSRHNPQFNEDTLRESLKTAKIRYLHVKGLGGLRHALKNSPNMGWRNASFRGFADYMQAEEFEESLAKLIEAAENRATVIMCAEAVPWRCHRSLIGDALLIRGVQVRHIMSASSSREHTLTPWARVKGTKITYPPELMIPQPSQ